MSLNISTNTAALRAGTQLGINQKHLQKSFDRLASGSKLSSPVDDPGGLAVSMKLSAADQSDLGCSEQCTKRHILYGGTGRDARYGG